MPSRRSTASCSACSPSACGSPTRGRARSACPPGPFARRMRRRGGGGSGKLVSASPFRDPLREDQVLKRVRHAAAELALDPHESERRYRVIMDMSVARQQAYLHELATAPLRVAYQGVE